MKRTNINFLIILILVFAMIVQPLRAQRDRYRTNLNAVLKKADQAYQDYKFAVAADYYDSYLYEATDNTEEPLRKLADCYWQMRNYNDALRTYNQLYQTDDIPAGASREERYRIAELYARFGQYEKATKWLSGVSGYQAKATTYNSYEKMDQMKEDSLSWNVGLLNISTSYRDFSPFLWGNTLFFCSNKLLPYSEKASDWDGDNFTHLWKVPVSELKNVPELASKDTSATAELKRSRKLAGAYSMGDKPLTQSALNSTSKQYYTQTNQNTIGSLLGGLGKNFFNVGPMSMDKYDHIYFSANYDKDVRGINRVGIMEGSYSATRGVLESHVLPLADPKTYSVMHPAINENGTILVFCSNKPGGKGGFDLYYVQRQNTGSSWGAVQSFSGNINTGGNEVFPTITPKGDLYFSSDALPGLGGLDIYRINLQDALAGRGEPLHLSYPVNSPADDFGLTQDASSMKGYFTSDRMNSDDNIYSFTYEARKQVPKFTVQGVVRDEISDKPIQNATLFLLNTKENKVYISKSDERGRYSFAVAALGDVVIKGVEKDHSDNCTILKINQDNNPGNTMLDAPDLLLGRFKPGAKWRLGNILYDKNNFNIRLADRPVLDSLIRILNQYPIKIEIGVHTDSRGSAAENEKDSQHSANSAIFYLLEHGIEPERIVSKGYGESELINKCSDGVPCSESEHQVNRRTEVKVTGFTVSLRTFQVDPDKFKPGTRVDKSAFPNGYFDTCK
jgi:outer membrane protein OmpA-like peptidoglycan-associated protein/tetratricopeptide (TPR) repeat protein